MSFQRTLNLFVNLSSPGGPGSSMLRSRSPNDLLSYAVPFVFGDCFTLALWFLTPDPYGVDDSAVETVDGSILVGGRAAPGGDLLFAASGFQQVGSGNTRHYEAVLNLNTAALREAIGTSATLAVIVDIELQNADNSRRMTYQFLAVVNAEYVATASGVELPGLHYPAPDQLVLRQQDYSPCKFAADGTPYLWEPVTQRYYAVGLQVVDGVVVLVASQDGVTEIP
jgi:hypothetical protein